jgi:hypothetical protein
MSDATKWIRVGPSWVNPAQIIKVVDCDDQQFLVHFVDADRILVSAADARELLAHIGAAETPVEAAKGEAIDHAKYNGDWVEVESRENPKVIFTYQEGRVNFRHADGGTGCTDGAEFRRYIDSGDYVRYEPKPAKGEAAGLEPGLYWHESGSLFKFQNNVIYRLDNGQWSLREKMTPAAMLKHLKEDRVVRVPMEGE